MAVDPVFFSPFQQNSSILKIKYLSELSELPKILPDLEFSDICCIEVSRVLAETFSSRRNLCSKLETFLRIWHSDRHVPLITVHSEGTIKPGVH